MPHPNPTFPVRLIIDRQEQLPFSFSGITARGAHGGGVWQVPTLVKKIDTGDYSLEGFEDRVAIERKSPEDLYRSITHDRERFEREVSRLNCFEGFAAIVVEADLFDLITNKPDFVTVDPKVLAGTFTSWTLKYRAVQWHFFRTRRLAEIMTFRFLHQWLEREMKEQEQEQEQERERVKQGNAEVEKVRNISRTGSKPSRKCNGAQDHYDAEEVEFMLEGYKLQKKLRRFPNYAELLKLAKELGWRHYPVLVKSEAELRVGE